jgi:hypothetical protein
MTRNHRVAMLAGLLASAAIWPAGGAGRAALVPELSGHWARTTFALEQPDSGPGPVRTLRLRTDNQGDLRFNLGDADSPILRPEAAAAVRARNDMLRSGVNVPTPSNQCTPMIAPYIFRVQQIQVVQGRDEVLLLYMQDHQVRHVRLNAAHPVPLVPSAHGDSIGHYEGDTLVVDTIGFKLGRVAAVDQYGTPYSEALHVVERYRLVDYEVAREAQARVVRENGGPATEQAAGIDPSYRGRGLQVRFTVEDKTYFTMPWSGAATYRRAGSAWVENVCAENPREYYANRDTPVPQTDRPDF